MEGTPQPDLNLRILPEYGGTSRREGKYLGGRPELLAEICGSSASYDLHDKLELYQAARIPEYLAVLLYDKEVRWHLLAGTAVPAACPGSGRSLALERLPGPMAGGQSASGRKHAAGPGSTPGRAEFARASALLPSWHAVNRPGNHDQELGSEGLYFKEVPEVPTAPVYYKKCSPLFACGATILTLTINAIYENGVLKLEVPLPLKEQEKVQITPNTTEDAVRRVRETAGIIPCKGRDLIERAALDPELSTVFPV